MTVEAHVFPVDDLIDHDLDSDDGCVCGPDQIPVKREDGSMAWIASHHSLDGREQQETT
jgi:hypothetical protein